MSGRSRIFMLFAMTAAGLAAGAQAQPAQNSVAGVTVLGKRPSNYEIRTIITPFVDVHAGRDRKTGLLVRLPPPGVCPLTLGLSPAFNAFVSARIVAVARQVGAPVDRSETCVPNVEVVFTDAPQDLVDTEAKRTGGRVLGFHYVSEYRRLAEISHPIQAWYMTGTTDQTPPEATGTMDVAALYTTSGTNPVGSHQVRPVRTFGPAGVVLDSAYGPDPWSGTGSHIRPRNSSELMNVLIVADLTKLDSVEIGPISDYIAMLSLTQAHSLDACGKLSSILDRWAGCEGRPPPSSLTDSDIAFLKALYAADITASGATGRYQVAHGMAGVVGEALAPKAEPPAQALPAPAR